ncbi:unnamed protein product [Ilex paraguariensis]|uniref:Uncharacterized protein n=1 Tax=Ilex paraguariensis TaxID=185542 RepID=A0ABC8QUY9_9AQUA
MERNGVRLGAVMVTLVVFMLAQNVTAEPVKGIYTCWGGCYNQCVLQTKTPSQRWPCYSKCLSNCIPRSPSDYRWSKTGKVLWQLCQYLQALKGS